MSIRSHRRYNRFLDREFNYSATKETKTVADFSSFLRDNDLQKWSYTERLLVFSKDIKKYEVESTLENILSMEYLRDHQDLYEMWAL